MTASNGSSAQVFQLLLNVPWRRGTVLDDPVELFDSAGLPAALHRP